MKQMDRRKFLFGAGGSMMALPWLELHAEEPSTRKVKEPSLRFASFYSPMGFVRDHFFPGEDSDDFLSMPTLKPLQSVADKVTLITGLYRVNVRGIDVHNQCSSCYLSSANPYGELKSPYPMDRTLDHLIADKVSHRTPIRSLELNCNTFKDLRESIYLDNISWYGPEHVATSMKDPRKVYRRLFRTGKSEKDITDLILEDAANFERALGREDKDKMDEYFTSVREVEKQIEKLTKHYAMYERADMKEPDDVPMTRGEYIRMMGKLLVLAFQGDLTHVATFMLAPERWGTPQRFHELNFTKSHHGLTHSQGRDDVKRALVQVDRFYVELFAEVLEQLDAIQEGEGTLLDHSMITLGSGLGDGKDHTMDELPIIVAGSANGKIKTGRVLNCSEKTPLANLWLSQAQLMGTGMQKFADSTGPLKGLLA
ncbi:MAG: hypothetical protein CMP26_12745 [Roseibacillus sp.]|mgnify:FL=1|nr:hypothetical protein [Roseibacillus sp.]MBQ63584.1 hypothetical protein [Euryarchaeota archaeon]HAO94563.1 hypothetical protein [Verrucomicrobiales bacterium]|tara:strand:+ start:1575 stop:2852 length:1278 start_codon:yes stop_codon:yes gene_type:complete